MNGSLFPFETIVGINPMSLRRKKIKRFSLSVNVSASMTELKGCWAGVILYDLISLAKGSTLFNAKTLLIIH